MKKLFFSFFVFLLFAIPLVAQSSTLDSLFEALDKASEDSIRVDIYEALGGALRNSRALDSAAIYLEKAIGLAHRSQLTERKAKATYQMGLLLKDQGKDSLALAYLLKAKRAFEDVGLPYERFYMHLHLGRLYERMANIRQAVIHYDSAAIIKPEGDPQKTYELNLNLAAFYWDQNKLEDTRQKYLENIVLAGGMEDSLQLYLSYGDLGSLYNDLNQPDSAIYYLEMALPVIQDYDPDWTACIYGCLGTNYKDIGKCDIALVYFNKALAGIDIPNESLECCSYAEMASCYLLMGDLEKANYYNDRAISLLDQATENGFRRATLQELVSLYKEQGEYERALLNLENLKQLEDTLLTAENNAAIEELMVKYQTREQQTQMELQSFKLNRQRTLIVISGILLVLLVFILFLAWRNMIYRKQTNKLLSERNDHLEELDQKKSRFFSNISHELRTPLTLVSAPLERIMDQVKIPEIRDHLQLAHRNSQKLLVLVDEILDLSKLESGQMELQLSSFQLEEVLRRIFFAFQSLADIRGLKLEFSSQLPKDVWVKADLPKLEKMLNNLTSNAIRYSDPGGVISLKLNSGIGSSGEQHTLIQLTDTGKGIPQYELTRIFDRFYQRNSGQLIGGTGIGLALTRELAHLFGGSIAVDSKVGEGSTFTLSLPLTVIDKPVGMGLSRSEDLLTTITEEGVAAAQSTSSGYVATLTEGSKKRLLIVEDNPEMSRFLKQTLSGAYECSIAYDGKEAIQQLETAYFDLVTSDVMMPQMDGFTLLEQVRKSSTVFRNIPFVLLTARSLETDKLEGFQLGVDDYITKPFSVRELIARIENLLKNKAGRAKWEQEETANKKSLKTAERFVLGHIAEADFGVHELAAHLAMSQRSMERLIKRLAGLSPVGFIREIRLQKAYQLLKRRQYLTVKEVRNAVGMTNASYFNRRFKERFGVSPKDLLGPVLKETFF